MSPDNKYGGKIFSREKQCPKLGMYTYIDTNFSWKLHGNEYDWAKRGTFPRNITFYMVTLNAFISMVKLHASFTCYNHSLVALKISNANGCIKVRYFILAFYLSWNLQYLSHSDKVDLPIILCCLTQYIRQSLYKRYKGVNRQVLIQYVPINEMVIQSHSLARISFEVNRNTLCPVIQI